ncbi:hypothetical protein ACFXEL_03785 [Streptomyces sp. NPDC059382]|uniref:hypothetical protein n=1 Tax=Streptomyces sp. NPDC059382 TaxID=3346816 RepID=UPI0036C702B9
MRNKFCATAAVLAFVVATAAAPVAAQAAAPPGGERIQDCPVPFGLARGPGKMSGTVCGNHVHGWVEDTKADGRCVFGMFQFSGSSETYYTPWAAPKGKKIEFDVWGPAGSTMAYNEIGSIPC